ncbi:PRP3-domain-containing protein [Sistotremastrum niveocremeum HHB9708]|uniref:PRP3-domain-containing protein n=1 Tax=Sistotremastrum niveocremeum HHB9708 TaxID=1314777 RepID=A0A164MSR9_9AGAM|nr:PRP3-domain-containing protein [Sistotremastrum niveocremeum HHB9708]
MAALKANKPAASANTSGPLGVPNSSQFSREADTELQRRVEEAKKKVNAAKAKTALKDNPYLSIATAADRAAAEAAPSGGGLKMSAHPLLLDMAPAAPQSKKDRYKPMQPKFASIKANARNAPTPPPVAPVPVESKTNPYASSSTAKDGDAPKDRASRSFRFNQKGKYTALGNQMRKDAQLEALKQRIAESAKKAGLDTEFETAEKNVKRAPPPAAEWWDMSLLPSKAYDDFSLANAYIRTADSPISIYIQHPIPIPAPADKDAQQLKPLKLTAKERKKVRKQRRQAVLQDKRDHIRMGLLPPDPPKVRLSNLMKVLTSDAVQDPTRVEARVRREVAMRKHTHEKMNAERKLEPEERRAKIEEKKVAEETKGLVGALFRVKILSDPAHRFKVRKNAEQLNLTGICIFHPAFSVVYVEGAAKFVRNYKKLMLNRIHWTEAARPRGESPSDLLEASPSGEASTSTPGPSSAPADAPTQTVNEAGETVSLEDNRCDCIWEGVIVERNFKNFKPKSCPNDVAAREAFGSKLSSRWDVAKNWKPQEEELF